MEDRLKLGTEVRELKLGTTFTSSNPKKSFHTLKYDFKPASVDLSKVATLDVSANNQVTVSVQNLDSSGTPKTVFKGNQRAYSKECVLIIDKVTGEITVEKLLHNIQVKKTRTENTNKPVPSISNSVPAPPSLENSTQRTVSKTKVSTGVRKNAISGFVPKHSPLQGSPSYPHHKSPQQAPAWNANNNQSTLPSIPLIDDDILPTNSHHSNNNSQLSSAQHHQQSYGSTLHVPTMNNMKTNHLSNHHSIGSSSSSNTNNHHNAPSNNPYQHQHHHSQSTQQQSVATPNTITNINHSEIASLSSSDSSSNSDSSGSGSDSDSGDDKSPMKTIGRSSNNIMNNEPLQALLLDEDLRLSESNSSDSDD